jgi:sugar phosphate isomerase/epimerase
MKLSIVLSLQPTQFSALAFQGRTEEHFQKIKSLGYDGAELAVRDPSLLDWDRLEKGVKISGLDVPAIGTGQAYVEEGLRLCSPSAEVREKSIERLKSHIPLAKRFQAGVIIGLIRGKVEKSEDFGKGYEWMIESLKACCAEAESENVPLWIEPLNRYETNLVNTLEEGWEVIQQLGGAKLGLLPDTFHMNIEERSIEDSFRKSAPYFRHVHIADSNRWAPGCGHLNFKSILETLREVGYQGFLSMEILPRPNPDEAARMAIQFFGKVEPT